VLPILTKAAAQPETATAATQSLTLTFVLKRDHQKEFEQYLRDVYDTHSKSFHHFLMQRQLTERFGPSRDDYDSVLSYLHANHFTLVEGSRNRLVITVSGTRAQVEKTFELGLHDYRIGHRSFFANDQDPALPSQLSARVQSVAGLSNLAGPVRIAHDAQNLLNPINSAPNWNLTNQICFPFTPVTSLNFIGVLEARLSLYHTRGCAALCRCMYRVFSRFRSFACYVQCARRVEPLGLDDQPPMQRVLYGRARWFGSQRPDKNFVQLGRYYSWVESAENRVTRVRFLQPH
jgi:hypothetical protein